MLLMAMALENHLLEFLTYKFHLFSILFFQIKHVFTSNSSLTVTKVEQENLIKGMRCEYCARIYYCLFGDDDISNEGNAK